MARPRDPRRDEAKRIWLESNGEIKLVDLADQMGVTSSTIRKWKATDKWDNELKGSAPKSNGSALKHSRGSPGAPKGNKNAVGNEGGAPRGNKNAVTHGLYETVVVESLSEEDQRLFYLAGEINGIDQELQIARFKVARLIQEQKKRKLNGAAVTKNGVMIYSLQDDFYEEVIEKGLELVARLEGRISKLRIEEEKLKIAKERLALEKTKVMGDDDDYEDDGFLAAIEGKEVDWNEET